MKRHKIHPDAIISERNHQTAAVQSRLSGSAAAGAAKKGALVDVPPKTVDLWARLCAPGKIYVLELKRSFLISEPRLRASGSYFSHF